ncbi:hypothetical protein GCM10008098_25380 [Rhodanobacter panaciterrae]|uniref:Uncharacterized protein n=1 Tax=Rhodanobacter panaciterrae TaxID=490572 RepID=A0ABQ3A345_9GAMM|nr:hypothetical protein GCM10008098_25380 [Rhodanobacter panaciterrae]
MKLSVPRMKYTVAPSGVNAAAPSSSVPAIAPGAKIVGIAVPGVAAWAVDAKASRALNIVDNLMWSLPVAWRFRRLASPGMRVAAPVTIGAVAMTSGMPTEADG